MFIKFDSIEYNRSKSTNALRNNYTNAKRSPFTRFVCLFIESSGSYFHHSGFQSSNAQTQEQPWQNRPTTQGTGYQSVGFSAQNLVPQSQSWQSKILILLFNH